jgi:hypothetical protein
MNVGDILLDVEKAYGVLMVIVSVLFPLDGVEVIISDLPDLCMYVFDFG